MITLNSLDKKTKQLEKKFVRQLRKEYSIAMKAINEQLVAMGAKADITDQVEMMKYNRLDTLQKNINKELAVLNRGTPQKVNGYLTDVYVANYEGVTDKISDLADLTFAKIERLAVYNAIQTPLEKLALEEASERVKQNIRRDLVQGVVQGEGIPKISRRIQNSLEKNLNNATRIARTETTRVMGESRLQAFEKSEEKGLKLEKVWIAASDSRTRDSHAELDGEAVPVDQPFSNGLMYPGDQSTGDPAETINCRCTMITRVIEN